MVPLEVNSVAQCETNDVCIIVTSQSRLHHLDSLTYLHSAHIDARFREVQHVSALSHRRGKFGGLGGEPAASTARQIQGNQSRIMACQTTFYSLTFCAGPWLRNRGLGVHTPPIWWRRRWPR